MDEGGVLMIADLGARSAGVIEIGGVSYVRDSVGGGRVFDPRQPEPEPGPLVLYTLSSLVDYLKTSKDFAATDECFLHVTPTTIQLRTGLQGRFRQRPTLVSVEAIGFLPRITFGAWMALEEWIILLQTAFVPSEGRGLALKVLGNVTDENVRQTSDDGVTQVVTGRVGIVSKQDITVPNPIQLKPFRTFPEVDQPEGMFVLRMKTGGLATLIVCDGNAWKLEAVKRLREWLVKAGVTIPILC
jgi:hypothetical protein